MIALLSGIGIASLGLFGLAYWWPDLCRAIAAILLTHADTKEEARDFRQRRWQQHRAGLLAQSRLHSEGMIRADEAER